MGQWEPNQRVELWKDLQIYYILFLNDQTFYDNQSKGQL